MVVVVIVVVVVAVLVAGGNGSSCGRSGSRYTRRRILLSCSDAAPTILVRSIRSDMGAREPDQHAEDTRAYVNAFTCVNLSNPPRGAAG
jgi:hypothetical protein